MKLDNTQSRNRTHQDLEATLAGNPNGTRNHTDMNSRRTIRRYERDVKVCIVGDTSVGKTSFYRRA